jgi:hypothetical protein
MARRWQCKLRAAAMKYFRGWLCACHTRTFATNVLSTWNMMRASVLCHAGTAGSLAPQTCNSNSGSSFPAGIKYEYITFCM